MLWGVTLNVLCGVPVVRGSALFVQFGALTPLEPRLGKKLIEPLTNLIHRYMLHCNKSFYLPHIGSFIELPTNFIHRHMLDLNNPFSLFYFCLLYTSDAADER